MIRVIAFDLDDTLWEVHPVITRAEQELGVWLGQEAPALAYDPARMRTYREQVVSADPAVAHQLTELRRRTIERALGDVYSLAEARQISTRAMEIFLEARNRVDFFEGALEAIQAVAKRYTLGAITNGNADIERAGLGEHFSFAFSAEQVGKPKPAPDLFLRALEHTGCEPHEMVYVGDDPVKDVDTANQLGLHTVWVRTEARPGPGATEPDHTIDHIRHLPGAIEALVDRNS